MHRICFGLSETAKRYHGDIRLAFNLHLQDIWRIGLLTLSRCLPYSAIGTLGISFVADGIFLFLHSNQFEINPAQIYCHTIQWRNDVYYRRILRTVPLNRSRTVGYGIHLFLLCTTPSESCAQFSSSRCFAMMYDGLCRVWSGNSWRGSYSTQLIQKLRIHCWHSCSLEKYEVCRCAKKQFTDTATDVCGH